MATFHLSDDENDLDAAEAELMGMNDGNEEKKSGIIKLTVYINKDEDDEDEDGKNVDLTKLFLREDEDFPFYIRL